MFSSESSKLSLHGILWSQWKLSERSEPHSAHRQPCAAASRRRRCGIIAGLLGGFWRRRAMTRAFSRLSRVHSTEHSHSMLRPSKCTRSSKRVALWLSRATVSSIQCNHTQQFFSLIGACVPISGLLQLQGPRGTRCQQLLGRSRDRVSFESMAHRWVGQCMQCMRSRRMAL